MTLPLESRYDFVDGGTPKLAPVVLPTTLPTTKTTAIRYDQGGYTGTIPTEFGNLHSRVSERLSAYKKTCERQEREISRLRDERTVLERKVLDVGATRTEVQEMQTVMEAWQAQAMGLQRELEAARARAQ